MRRQLESNTEQIDRFERGKYYFVNNTANDLFMTTIKVLQKETLAFEKQNHFDLRQVWMIEEISQQTYQIVNPYSSMVIQSLENAIQLSSNKQKNSQTFYIQKSCLDLQKMKINIFTIKEYKQSKKFLFSENGTVKIGTVFMLKDQCNKWKIQPISQYSLISQSFVIQNLNSGLVISINDSSQDEGQKIVQNLMGNSFSQRWTIITKNQFFMIKSVKTSLVLDICHQKMKQGTSIIQWKPKDSLNQLWKLEEYGKRIYIIRSALNDKFKLGVRGNSLKQGAELIITKNQSQGFWRIWSPFWRK